MNIFHLRMLLASRKQILRDISDQISQEKIDELLDQIAVLTQLIEQLEKIEDGNQ